MSSGFAKAAAAAKTWPDLVKIELVRGISSSPAKKAIVNGIAAIAGELGIVVLAEGVESEPQMLALRAAGVSLLQGYRFARSEVEYFRLASEIPALQALAA